MPRPEVLLRVNHQQRGFGFQKRSFGVEPPVVRHLRTNSAVPRVELPDEIEIREVAKEFALQSAFTKRNKRLFEIHQESRVANFQKVYRLIASRIRGYQGRDAVEMDIFLALKEYVEHQGREQRSVSRYQLRRMAGLHVDAREEMVVRMASGGELVPRPMAPKDARERGDEAYTEAAARRHKDLRFKDRITVMATLPDNPGAVFFITLGPATKRIDGRRVKCDRRVISVQTSAEWNAWKKSRIRDRQEYRNYHPRPRRDYALN